MNESKSEFNNVNVVSSGFSVEQAQNTLIPGQALQQTRSQYQCAVSVQKPRELVKIRRAVLEEARMAKDEFFWTWLVKCKDGKKRPIEGGTIALAQSMLVNYTNCAIIPQYEEKNGRWRFETTFIDFEKGITLSRHLLHSIPKAQLGSHDMDRTINMAFQVAQSKNIRDVVFLAIYRWLRQEAIEEAKKASEEDIAENFQEVISKAMNYFALQDIHENEIAAYLGKKKPKFNNKDVAFMRNLATQLKNGEVSPDSIKAYKQTGFESPKSQHTPPRKEEEVTDDNLNIEQNSTVKEQGDVGDQPQKKKTFSLSEEFEAVTGYNNRHFNNIKSEESFNKFLEKCPKEKIIGLPEKIKNKILAKYKQVSGQDLFPTTEAGSISTIQENPTVSGTQQDKTFLETFYTSTGFSWIYFEKMTQAQMAAFLRMNKEKIKDFPAPIAYEIKKKYKALHGKELDFPLSEKQQKVATALNALPQPKADEAWAGSNVPPRDFNELTDAECENILTMIEMLQDTKEMAE